METGWISLIGICGLDWFDSLFDVQVHGDYKKCKGTPETKCDELYKDDCKLVTKKECKNVPECYSDTKKECKKVERIVAFLVFWHGFLEVGV